jgi:hypothetical protein
MDLLVEEHIQLDSEYIKASDGMGFTFSFLAGQPRKPILYSQILQIQSYLCFLGYTTN